eukprot:4923054-Amphidinium_carterae.3
MWSCTFHRLERTCHVYSGSTAVSRNNKVQVRSRKPRNVRVTCALPGLERFFIIALAFCGRNPLSAKSQVEQLPKRDVSHHTARQDIRGLVDSVSLAFFPCSLQHLRAFVVVHSEKSMCVCFCVVYFELGSDRCT